MNEQPPQEHDGPDEPVPRPASDSDLWDPDERAGDIYRLELDDQGRVSRADKLGSTEQAAPDRPHIWVGSWLDYNNGVLYGQWIDAARDDDAIWADITAMLHASPTATRYGDTAEDWGIFDYEGFGPLRIGEQETVSYVGAVARGIAEHGVAYAAWAELSNGDDTLDQFTDAYLGHHASAEAFGQQLIDDFGYDQLLDAQLPPHLRPYVQIDVNGIVRDMRVNGDIYILPADDGGVWIFDGGT